jgi:microcystin-dependent protein
MSEVFVGQVLPVAFPFAPRGLAKCDGQILPLSQNQALFSLLGTVYGGNGTTTFALPDLRGRVPVGFGPSADPGWPVSPYELGEKAGTETVMLTIAQLPSHAHQCSGTTTQGDKGNPTNALYGANSAPIYGTAGAGEVTLAAGTIARVGGNLAHNNVQPFTAINFCIALTGIFPSRN